MHFCVFPFADQLVDFDRRVVEIAFGEVVEVVVALAGIEQIVGDHRVERRAGQFDAGGAEDDHVVLQILAELGDRRIFENRLEGRERGGRIEHCSPSGPRTGT